MKSCFLIAIILFLTAFVTPLAGQRFDCNSQLMIASYDGEATSILRPIQIPFNIPFFSPIVKYDGESFDAIGFNSKDNYIYGVQSITNSIVRLRQNNTYEVIGQIPGGGTIVSNAGDCTVDGMYMCHIQERNQILVFEVVDQFELVHEIDLFWDPLSVNVGPFETKIFDFAVDPNDPKVAYSYQSGLAEDDFRPDATRGYMLRINLDFDSPNVGMVTPVERLDPSGVSFIGGLLFTAESQLYGFGTEERVDDPLQEELFEIGTYNGQKSHVAMNFPKSLRSDGCSCPYSFTFTNSVPYEGMACNNDEKIFEIVITNSAYNAIEGAILRDTFPEGMIIQNVSNTFNGNIVPGTGVGAEILEISDLTIPAKSVVEIRVNVQSFDAVQGFADNQVFLYNLPERFEGGVLGSDETATLGVLGDPSDFYIYAPRFEEVSWEVTPASNCLEADDGKIKVISPQLLPGLEYEVTVINRVGYEESVRNVVIDQGQSFVLDSLLPGDYQLVEVKPKSENCSLSLLDSIIVLDPPNYLLEAQISSNSPLCEGSDLQLESEISPSGDVRWIGPNLFGSEDLDPIITDASSDNSGEYNISVVYGYCIQERMIEVEVSPQVSGRLEGKISYCEREDLSYAWSGPTGPIVGDSLLVLDKLNADDGGYYEVIIDNVACSDTVGQWIEILPTPTLSLPDAIVTDYCEPVVLFPELIGDTDVSYQWTPQQGLSCADCADPQVEPIVQDRYKLKVMNESMCADSASMSIRLDKTSLAFVPNIFRPFSIGGNDQFDVEPGCVVDYVSNIQIYNRWGSKVFESGSRDGQTIVESWDGRLNGQIVSAGVYLWIAEVVLVDGESKTLTGGITVIRD